jgi:hypothetical protein
MCDSHIICLHGFKVTSGKDGDDEEEDDMDGDDRDADVDEDK